jgi:hypothetical protein
MAIKPLGFASKSNTFGYTGKAKPTYQGTVTSYGTPDVGAGNTVSGFPIISTGAAPKPVSPATTAPSGGAGGGLIGGNLAPVPAPMGGGIGNPPPEADTSALEGLQRAGPAGSQAEGFIDKGNAGSLLKNLGQRLPPPGISGLKALTY